VDGSRPVNFYGRCGGSIPSAEEIVEAVLKTIDDCTAKVVEEVLTHA